jgi:hypothetical protein
VQIDKETVSDLYHGVTVVGTQRTFLTDKAPKAYKGVLLRCPGSTDDGGGNSVSVYVGGRGVTADKNASGGIPITPGTAMFVPIEDASRLFVIATANNQHIAWMLV